MKKYLLILIGCIFYLNLSAQADDDKNWLSIAYNNNQYGSVLRIPLKGALGVDGSGVTVGVERYLTSSFNLTLSFSVGEIYESELSRLRANHFGGQLIGKYKLTNGKLMPEDAKFAPFLGLGLGILSFDKTVIEGASGADLAASPILGFDYKINERFKMTASASYRINSSVSYREFSIGAGLSLSKKADSDGDGIPDNKDGCPTDFGPKDNDGCPYPDRDGDGVIDLEDKCPDVAGTVDGCPDQDGDGIPDAEDKCPNEAGQFSGCKVDPDAPKEPVKEEDPVKSEDPIKAEDPIKTEDPVKADDPAKTGDPVKGDSTATPVTEPVLRPGRTTQVDPNDIYRLPMEFVAFNPGSDIIRPEQRAELDRLAEMMLEDESFKVELNGYGDRGLSSQENFELARKRVVIIRNYLIRKGVNPYRFINSIRGTPRVTGTAGRVVIRAL